MATLRRRRKRRLRAVPFQAWPAMTTRASPWLTARRLLSGNIDERVDAGRAQSNSFQAEVLSGSAVGSD
jgi:hypothetical protein